MTGAWDAADRVRTNAAEVGAEPAILDGAVRWTWADLDERADALAGELERARARRGDVVALLATPSAPAVAGLLAILRVGAVAAPVPGGLTDAELGTVTTVLRPALVLHDAAAEVAARTVAGVAAATGRGQPALVSLTVRPRPAPAAAADATGNRVATDPAVVVLTSGTTGRPKGVLLSARALAASAEAWIAALPTATGWVLALGLGHVAGLGVLWRAIAARVPIRIVAPNDPEALLAGLRAEPTPSHVSLVPTQLRRLLDRASNAPPPTSLRAVLLGGGTIPPSLVRRAIRAGWPVLPTYGLSEAASGVTVLSTAEAARHPSSAGRPLPGVRLRIDDPDATGVGEIVVDTPARFSGYLHDEAATAAGLGRAPERAPELVPDAGPDAGPDADRWFHSGDLGRLDGAGRLTVVDRRTDRIVRGGENISPAEIEAVLVAHPAIEEAAVIGRPDVEWGHVPVAAVVLRDPAVDPGDAALLRHCRASLAGFKIPVAFVRVAALPRTASGKLRRAELQDRLVSPPTPATPPSEPSEMAGLRGVLRPDGVRVAWRETGDGSLPVLLLHGTLSNARQLATLASELAGVGDLRVLAVDRRGSGASRLANPSSLEIGVHVADLLAILDAEGIGAVALVGISYGGVVALEFAVRHPERVLAVAVWEPPYGPLAAPADAARLVDLAAATETAYRDGGPARAAETFLRGVAGDEAWERLSPRGRAFIEGEGDGAFVDVRLSGLDPAGLARIRVSVAVLTGDASEPLYGPIADALTARIPSARRISLPGFSHAAPILDPTPVAAAVRRALGDAGVLPSDPRPDQAGPAR